MKKLMIAAAAAAMIGGASADVYNFSASLKTTAGKGGKATNVSVMYGKDALGTVWYKDLAFNYADAAGNIVDAFGDPIVPPCAQTGAYINVISYDSKRQPTITQKDFDALKNQDYLRVQTILARYIVTRAKDKCLTLKVTIPAGCYRVAGTRKWEGFIYGTDCCGANDMTIDVYEKARQDSWNDGNIVAGAAFTPTFINVFGALLYNRSLKCEMADVAGVFPTAAFAGQGTGKWVTSDALGNVVLEYFRPTSVSGNIVGTDADPDCVLCCDDNNAARYFDCQGFDVTGTIGTAFYGTWSIKYNASIDKKYLNGDYAGNPYGAPMPAWVEKWYR